MLCVKITWIRKCCAERMVWKVLFLYVGLKTWCTGIAMLIGTLCIGPHALWQHCAEALCPWGMVVCLLWVLLTLGMLAAKTGAGLNPPYRSEMEQLRKQGVQWGRHQVGRGCGDAFCHRSTLGAVGACSGKVVYRKGKEMDDVSVPSNAGFVWDSVIKYVFLVQLHFHSFIHSLHKTMFHLRRVTLRASEVAGS